MTNNNYSKITLFPEDKGERQKFKEFRDEDVASMFAFVSAMAACEVLINLVAVFSSLFTGKDLEFALINFVYQLDIAIAMWVVWMLGKRFKSKYNLMIAAVYVFIQLSFALTIEIMSHYEDPDFVVITKLVGYFVIFLLLLAPSIHFVLFYALVYSTSIIYVV